MVEDGPYHRSLLPRVARDHQSLGNSRRVWEESSSVILNPLMRQCDGLVGTGFVLEHAEGRHRALTSLNPV